MKKTMFRKGEIVVFTSSLTGRRFRASYVGPAEETGKALITIIGDPYPVPVRVSQVSREGGEEVSPVTNRPESRKLAKEARMLGIRGFDKMKLSELRAAVEEAKEDRTTRRRPTSKRAPAKKAAARKAPASPRKAQPRKVTAKKVKAAPKKAAVAKKRTKRALDPSNPFRPGSNLHLMTQELLDGGSRADMVRRLKKAMPLHPWSKDKEEDPEFAINKRLLMTAADLEKTHGFTIVREGRGSAGTIQAFPPGKSAGRKTAKKATGQKRASKVTSTKTKKRATRGTR